MTKAQKERQIFESLVPLVGLILTPNSIQQNDPPAPDIECQVQNVGPLAVELLSLDAEISHIQAENRRLNCAAWQSALKKLRPEEQETLNANCKNVHINIIGLSNICMRDRMEKIRLMQWIQERLREQKADFTGYLPCELCAQLHFCRCVKVIRGKDITNGPRINTPSVGSWQMPQISKIKKKLTQKNYLISAPLELWAYSAHNEVDAHVDSLKAIDKCIKVHLGKSQFQRVLVFDLWRKTLERTHFRQT